MRIAFFGATEVGKACCNVLLALGQDVVGILTMPRDFSISYSKNRLVRNVLHANMQGLGEEHDIPVVEVTGKMADYVDVVRSWKPDFILVVGWYYMIPKVIRDLAPLGCAGIHASLLPRFAGGAPLVWAIINGETETGVSLFYFDDGVDSGDLIAQSRFPILWDDTIETVLARAEREIVSMVLFEIPKLAAGTASRIPQKLEGRRIWPQREPEDGLIDWTQSPEAIHNFIRAQTRPYPGAFASVPGGRLIVWGSHLAGDDGDLALDEVEFQPALKESE